MDMAIPEDSRVEEKELGNSTTGKRVKVIPILIGTNIKAAWCRRRADGARKGVPNLWAKVHYQAMASWPPGCRISWPVCAHVRMHSYPLAPASLAKRGQW